MDLDLQNKTWKEFKISSLFVIKRGNAKNITKRKTNKGGIAIVSAIDSNNGVYGITDALSNETIYINKLTIHNNGNGVGLVFFHKYKFIATSDVSILIPNTDHLMNGYIASYIKRMLEFQREKFSYGYKLSNNRLNSQVVVLPVDAQGNPDYAFMEAYMKQKEQEKLDKYRQFVTKRLTELQSSKNVDELDSREWSEFVIEDIFHVKSGVRLTKAEMTKGNKPFIGATDSNNGITDFTSNTNNSADKNVLGVNYNGSVVENFYHPYSAIFSDDVKRLSFRSIEGNRHLYIFVKTQILKQRAKYQYGYKFNAKRMKRQKIMLPVNQAGAPDYEYMEDYMKQLEYQRLSRYLSSKAN